MKVINYIPIEFDVEQLMRTIRVKRLSEQELVSLVEECSLLIKPKAVYTLDKLVDIEKDEIHLQSGYTLKSIILADTLKDGQTIAPYVITIGSKLEEKASETSKASVFKAWVIESIGDYALRKAFSHVESQIKEKLGASLSSFGPGTGTGKLFGIDQQAILFKILDPPKTIGVRLTSSYLMVPRKSISGILASTPKEYVACQYCPREKCENRRKPFSGEYTAVSCELRDQ